VFLCLFLEFDITIGSSGSLAFLRLNDLGTIERVELNSLQRFICLLGLGFIDSLGGYWNPCDPRGPGSDGRRSWVRIRNMTCCGRREFSWHDQRFRSY